VLDQFERRLDPITGKPGARADADGSTGHTENIPKATAARVITIDAAKSQGIAKR
jgi:hypothetical protein